MFLRSLALTSLFLASHTALADWQVTSDSRVSFQTIKNTNTMESHTFNKVSGTLMDSGAAMISIDLSSVSTGIAVRDKRMQTMLFETSKYATANFQTMLSKSVLGDLQAGKTVDFELQGTLALHGERQRIRTMVKAVPIVDGSIVVTTLAPFIVEAADFALVDGINSLREAAGLESITTAVPVSFTLTLSQ